VVRASRNASNARRANGHNEAPFDARVGAQFSIAPGMVTERDRQAYRALYAPGAAPGEPPGTVLDGQKWARSWPAFLAALGNEGSGAAAAISNAMGERVPAEGGFLVPEVLRQQVLAYMMPAIVRPRAMVLPMGTLRLGIPLLDSVSQSGGNQNLGGLQFSIVEEKSSIPATVATFGKVALEARKLAAYLVNVPNELTDDSGQAFGDFMARVIAMGWAWAEDDLLIGSGTGVGEPQALLNAPGGYIVTRNTSNEVLDVDVVAMVKALHPASKASAVWLISEDVFDQLLDLYLTVGSSPSGADVTPSPLLEFDMDHGCWRLLGLPAFPNDHQPALGTTGDLMLCDLSLMVIGDRQELLVERSPLGAGFPLNASNWRIKVRMDARYWPQETYTLANGKTVSPLVILQ
jgi:HK97 family phage major capsid protein